MAYESVKRVFVGFGFGAIQAGLFLFEAFRSGNFDRLVVAEINPQIVARLRSAGGRYRLQVATRTGIETHEVTGVEVFAPDDPSLVTAVAEATELCTALPSVAAYPAVARLIAGTGRPCVIYTAENHNHAAEILECAVGRRADRQFLNTVIGKMSGVSEDGFLVEEFNRILISKITLPGFHRGITVFEEKPDLFPFEEAKLYGHNGVHALLGYLAHRQGFQFMADAKPLLPLAREAFLEESGRALIAKHGGVDSLFTAKGFERYAEDLLERMVNPFLRDTVARVIRDPRRKLGWNDRLIGTMRLVLDAGITPHRFALAAKAAFELVGGTLDELWPEPDDPPGRKQALKDLILSGKTAG